jgi:pyruvate formate lyase activating enzyme
MLDWKATWRSARLEERLPNGIVRCHLSPRNCTIRDGQRGFCGVRGNVGGRLVTFNYGKAVHLTEETIETEAVNHYAPGLRILSLGNIGCMLSCAYCHNWKTSQTRYLSDADVFQYTPEGVVETALRHGIKCLSWTYNDPVVWHEFILDTARLARAAGLLNLYKSAFFISPEAVDELLPVIDIFSISIKSLDPAYYTKLTTGRLEPVLEATRQVHRAGKHLEVSTLMVTDVSDDEATARKVADWLLRDLAPDVPLHFVRFHPDFRMRDTTRTPVERLVRAREVALAMGVRSVYLGNVYDTPFSNTYCRGCSALLVDRYGLNARAVGLAADGRCAACGEASGIRLRPADDSAVLTGALGFGAAQQTAFGWHGDIRSLHVRVVNEHEGETAVYHRRRYADGTQSAWTRVLLAPFESYRFIIAKARPDEVGTDVALGTGVRSNLLEVYDRAHFPTVSLEDGTADDDVTPLPVFSGKPLTVARARA